MTPIYAIFNDKQWKNPQVYGLDTRPSANDGLSLVHVSPTMVAIQGLYLLHVTLMRGICFTISIFKRCSMRGSKQKYTLFRIIIDLFTNQLPTRAPKSELLNSDYKINM